MVINTEWSQVEIIDLINDGSGLGFGIVGGRSTGVVVKSILPGGIADRDGRLQSGDHILQIGDVYTRGLASEHVATLLRQSGVEVQLLVARPIDSSSTDYRTVSSNAPIVPTKLVTNPEELNLLLLQNGYIENGSASTPIEENEIEQNEFSDNLITKENSNVPSPQNQEIPEINLNQSGENSPESEIITVVLEKNQYGLGITVAGYVWEREELSGIFVKGINEASAAGLCGQILINDRIVEVDQHDLRPVTNHEAVEFLKRSGRVVTLTLERYLRGPRYEHLQDALHTVTLPKNSRISPSSPTTTALSWIPVQTETENIEIENESESYTTVDSGILEPQDPETIEIFVDTNFDSGSVTPDMDEAVKRKWEKIVSSGTEVVVTQLRKLRGLGISLEGTVEVEDGIELRPRHFIRSILPEGPVGRDGILSSGDELLEVNGQRLVGKNHVEVVQILRELPETVRIVCARNSLEDNLRIINTAQDIKAFAARSILGGSLKTLLIPEKKSIKSRSVESLNNNNSNHNEISSSLVTLQQEVLNSNSHLTDSSNCCNNNKLNNLILLHNSTFEKKHLEDNNKVNLNSESKNNNLLFEKNNSSEDSVSLNDIDKETLCEKNVSEIDNFNCEKSSNSFNNLHHEVFLDSESNLSQNIENNKINNSIQNNLELRNNLDVEKLGPNIEESNFKNLDEASETIKFRRKNSSIKKNHTYRKSRSLEAITYLATWKEEVEYVDLVKNEKGLGFAILDYQDPINPHGTVIVLRSLVANGPAAHSQKLKPGDRIMSVNDYSLKNVTLDEAVRALKSVPSGKVKIGYSKPMSFCSQEENCSPRSINDNFFIW